MNNTLIKKIDWDDSYLLGIQEIDLQHKKLILIANELYDIATRDDQNYKILMPKVIKKLSDYTEYHFTAEENFMKRYGYAGSENHKAQHDGFVKEIRNQITKLSSGTKKDFLEFYNYISRWILEHIAKSDQVWAAYVKTKI
jgi:hemerythrin family protein